MDGQSDDRGGIAGDPPVEHLPETGKLQANEVDIDERAAGQRQKDASRSIAVGRDDGVENDTQKSGVERRRQSTSSGRIRLRGP